MDDETPEDAPRTPTPWEQLPGEPTLGHGHFVERLAFPGSLEAWCRETGRNPRTMRALAAQWRWSARFDAYHAHLRRCAFAAAADEAGEVGREHGRGLRMLRELAMDSILDHLAQGRRLPIRDALAAFKLAIDGERLAMGEATSRVDIGAIPPAVLAALDREILGEDEPEPSTH